MRYGGENRAAAEVVLLRVFVEWGVAAEINIFVISEIINRLEMMYFYNSVCINGEKFC